MKHNISLRIYKPKKNEIVMDPGDFEQSNYGEDEKLKNCKPRPRALKILSLFWDRLSEQAKSDEETVIIATDPKKRGHDNKLKSSLQISELGVSSNHVSRYMNLILILQVTLQNLQAGGTTTLRDMYYRDVAAFGGRQSRLNTALQLLARSFQLSPEDDLQIVPSPKGLMWGGPNIELQLEGGDQLTLNYSANYLLVPYLRSAAELTLLTPPQVIVVFEKEAVFKSFCDHTRQIRPEKNVLALTGRGFPDTRSKQFLRYLHERMPSVPVLVFVDSDVYGVRIFWNYQEMVKNAILAGVFLFEYQAGWLGINSRERRVIVKTLERNETWRREQREEKKDEKKEEKREEKKVEKREQMKEENFKKETTGKQENSEVEHLLKDEEVQPNQLRNQKENEINEQLQEENHNHQIQPVLEKAQHLVPFALPFLQPETQYGNKLIQYINAKTTHRELTRALLIGIKAEMNILSSRSTETNLPFYLWNKINCANPF